MFRQSGQAELHITRQLGMGLTVEEPVRLQSGEILGNQGDNRSVIHFGGSVCGPSRQR
jgi:hypothetical protein